MAGSSVKTPLTKRYDEFVLHVNEMGHFWLIECET